MQLFLAAIVWVKCKIVKMYIGESIVNKSIFFPSKCLLLKSTEVCKFHFGVSYPFKSMHILIYK